MFQVAVPLSIMMLAIAGVASDSRGEIRVAQLSVRERITIRVPRMTRTAPTPVRWRERKGPKCVAAADMRGTLVSDPRNVDIVLAGNRRVRARLERACGSINFYSGFYLRPGDDGMICADRDVIRTRSGGSCEISVFKRLEVDN